MKYIPLIDSLLIVSCISLMPGVGNAQTDAVINEKPIAVNFNSSSTNSTVISFLKAPELVSYAYQGGLLQQGIPSGGTLVLKTLSRNIIAKDLVRAAVNAKKLPAQVMNDQSYLNAVGLQLEALPDEAAFD
ncbi:hypothetical protein WKK05_40715 (plasmid) [Nostoc sp. UHCC 0302]|uniref:hypothetical protein n=1 Tax=Nostoc sp. UHCC 0302 TaxID=3134896 RepID=UPI00311CCABE